MAAFLRRLFREAPLEALFARLAAIASGQHALITLAQLIDLGVTRHQRQRLVASGHLARVAPRVWLVNGAPFTWQARALAESLSAGDGALVSHRTAASLYGLDGFDPFRTVHITVPRGRSLSPRRDLRAHYVFDYDLIRPTTRQRAPVTDAARLVLDLYASEPNPAVARRALFSVRKKNLASWTELFDCLEAHARQGRRGIAALRPDLDLFSRIGCPETTFEDAIRALLMKAGLPGPELQHWVTAGGSRYRIDVAYPDAKVGVEGRSKAHHFTDEAFEADPVRDADLATEGWLIIHVTWAQLSRNPEGVVRRVARALSRRAGVATSAAADPALSGCPPGGG